MLCFVMLCLLYIYCFFPLFSPVDPETDDAPVIDYGVDDPSFLPEQPGKPTPFDHSDIAHSLLSYACIRTATAFLYDPILMHSLLLLLLSYLTCLY